MSLTPTPHLRIQDPLDRALVGEWRFHRNTGSILPDSSGNAIHGTIAGPTWARTRYGPGLDYDPANEYVSLGTTRLLDLPAPFTLEVFCYIDAFADYNPFYNRGAGSGTGVSWYLTAARNVRVWDGGSTGLDILPSGPQWHHGILVVRGPTVDYYTNGEQKLDAYAWDYAQAGSATAYIGAWDQLDGFDGRILLFRAYDRILGPAEARRRCQICLSRASGASAPLFVPLPEEAAANALTRLLASTVALEDAPTRLLGRLRPIASTLATTEATLRPRTLARLIAHTQALNEATSRPRILARITSAAQAITPSPSYLRSRLKHVASTLSLPAATAHVRGRLQHIASTPSISEATHTILGFIRLAPSTLSIPAANSKVPGFVKRIASTIAAAANPIHSTHTYARCSQPLLTIANSSKALTIINAIKSASVSVSSKAAEITNRAKRLITSLTSKDVQ